MPYLKPGSPEWHARNDLIKTSIRTQDPAASRAQNIDRIQAQAQAPIPATAPITSDLPWSRPKLRSKGKIWELYLEAVFSGAHVPTLLIDNPDRWPKIVPGVEETLPLGTYGRFMGNIDIHRLVASDCWMWIPPSGRIVRPSFAVTETVTVTAASFAYVIWVDRLAVGDRVMHSCKTGSGCVKPQHLRKIHRDKAIEGGIDNGG